MEAQSLRLLRLESYAEEEYNSLLQSSSRWQLENQALRNQLLNAESAETSTKNEAKGVYAEAHVAVTENRQLRSELSELRNELLPAVRIRCWVQQAQMDTGSSSARAFIHK